MTTPAQREELVNKITKEKLMTVFGLDLEKLVTALLKDDQSERPNWRRRAIISMVPKSSGGQKIIVRLDNHYLRFNKGPRQGHYWDHSVADDYVSAEEAFVALLEAPIPHWLLTIPESAA